MKSFVSIFVALVLSFVGVQARAQCGPGTEPNTFVFPPLPPMATWPNNCSMVTHTCRTNFENYLDVIEFPLGSGCYLSSFYNNAINTYNNCVAQAYNDYINCLMLTSPPENVTPPPGIECPEGYGCFPDDLCPNLPYWPPPAMIPQPWNPVDPATIPPTECWNIYINALMLLCQEYREAVTQCSRNNLYCWDCQCLNDLEEYYSHQATVLYVDMLLCMPNHEAPPAED